MATHVATFITDLDAGMLEKKMAATLSNIAAAVIDTGKQGELSIGLKIKQIGSSHQVQVTHKISMVKPTWRGKETEEDTTATPMHVGRGGDMTFFPDTQETMTFDNTGVTKNAD